jgi:hypothetical protein
MATTDDSIGVTLLLHPKAEQALKAIGQIADYRPGHRTAHQAWVRIPGKHKNRELAWEALEEIMLTRH